MSSCLVFKVNIPPRDDVRGLCIRLIEHVFDVTLYDDT